MSYVVSGSRLTWSGDFGTLSFLTQSSGDTIQAVGAGLSNKYNLLIERANNVGDWSGLQARTITLDLRSDMDRSSDNDIRGNIMDEFASAGAACIASRIISITPPGGQAQGTGAPGTPPGGNPASNVCVGFWDCIGSGEFSAAFGNLTGQVEAGSVGFILGGVAIIGLILYLGMREQVA